MLCSRYARAWVVSWVLALFFASSGILPYREICLPLSSSARGCLLQRSLFRGHSCMVKPIVARGFKLVCESVLCTRREYMIEYECDV